LNTVAALSFVKHGKISPVLHSFVVESESSDSALYIVHPVSIEEDLCARDLAVLKHSKNENLCRAVLRQVLEVIDYLHKHDLIWFDVRGNNIFITKNGIVKVQLVSLRSVVQLKTRDSLPFVAPELVTRSDVSREHVHKLDVWSFGMTGIQLWTGEQPYSAMNAGEVMKHIVESSPPVPEDAPQDFQDVLNACFERSVEQRVSAAKLLQFPFFANTTDEKCVAYLEHFVQSSLETPDPPEPQLVQEVSNNCPIESYLGETATHFVVVIRTIPATQVSFLLEAGYLKISAKLPTLITEPGVTLLTPQNLTSEKVIHFPGPISPVDAAVTQDTQSNSIVLRIQKFLPVNLGSTTFIT